MPSGRVASIDLRQSQEAIDDAQQLLRTYGGAVPLNEERPEAVAAARGENTTTTQQEAGANMSIITETTDNRGIIRPIYGPNDPRWYELAAWFEQNADRLIDDDGAPGATLKELWPSERGAWHASRVLGIVPSFLDVDFPSFPDDAGAPPQWATGSEPHGNGVTDCDELPSRIWDRRLIDEGTVSVDLVREDTFNPDTREVVAGPERISLWIADDRVDLSAEDATPDGLRRIASALLMAANAAERELN